jgi:hypothetical protein
MAGGPPFVFLPFTVNAGALPFPGFGKGGRSGCFGVIAFPCCPMRLDLYCAGVSGEVMTEAGPWPVLWLYHQAPADWVAVHVLEFLDGLVVVPHVEVIVAALRESYISRPFELSRDLLFQHLEGYLELKLARFADQQVNVFGHDDITSDNKAVAPPHLFQFSFKEIVPGARFEQRLSSITTEGKKVKITRMLIAD